MATRTASASPTRTPSRIAWWSCIEASGHPPDPVVEAAAARTASWCAVGRSPSAATQRPGSASRRADGAAQLQLLGLMRADAPGSATAGSQRRDPAGPSPSSTTLRWKAWLQRSISSRLRRSSASTSAICSELRRPGCSVVSRLVVRAASTPAICAWTQNRCPGTSHAVSEGRHGTSAHACANDAIDRGGDGRVSRPSTVAVTVGACDDRRAGFAQRRRLAIGPKTASAAPRLAARVIQALALVAPGRGHGSGTATPSRHRSVGRAAVTTA